MHSVTVTTHLSASPDQVWSTIGDPGTISAWHPAIAESSLDGTSRVCSLANGARIDEQVDTVDATNRSQPCVDPLGNAAGYRKADALIGVTHDGRVDSWENAPKVEESMRLATFPLRRAEQRAVVTLDTPELLDFLKADQSGEVGFMIHCETPGSTLVHGFASSQHREAAGPVLELVMKKY